VADLILSLADGVDHALLRGLAGPLVALLEHSLRLRARLRQRRQWEGIEAQLSAEAGHHSERSPEIGERPCPLREGAIERYAEKAGMLALGAFGFGLASSGDLEGSAGAVLAALPRPAVLGRSAFALELSHRLAESGALLLEDPRCESARNRYFIDPIDLLRVIKDARSRDLEILGYYHSHPDQPAQPSTHDRELAWPGYSYLIVEVLGGEPQEMTCWVLPGEGGRFAPEPVEWLKP
jgi:hypothetical protein